MLQKNGEMTCVWEILILKDFRIRVCCQARKWVYRGATELQEGEVQPQSLPAARVQVRFLESPFVKFILQSFFPFLPSPSGIWIMFGSDFNGSCKRAPGQDLEVKAGGGWRGVCVGGQQQPHSSPRLSISFRNPGSEISIVSSSR